MESSSCNRTPLDAIEYMIHHIFLPPKLPNKDDFHPQHESVLLKATSDALQKFKANVECDQQDVIETICIQINNLSTVRDDLGAINEGKLGSILQKLSKIGMLHPFMTSWRVPLTV